MQIFNVKSKLRNACGSISTLSSGLFHACCNECVTGKVKIAQVCFKCDLSWHLNSSSICQIVYQLIANTLP